MKRSNNCKAFTLIELLVVVAIIGILAAVGVVAYNGYTTNAKANASKSNMDIVYKTWLNEKTLCEVKDPKDKALWGKTGCDVMLSTASSDVFRARDIIKVYFGANNNYGFGQPILNIYKPQGNFIADCSLDITKDEYVGQVRICWDNNMEEIVFNGCFKTPCSDAKNRFQKRIGY